MRFTVTDGWKQYEGHFNPASERISILYTQDEIISLEILADISKTRKEPPQ